MTHVEGEQVLTVRVESLVVEIDELLGNGRGVHDDCLEVADIDVVDGTPLLDIKPYVPEFDSYPGSKAGWFDESSSQMQHADDRFHLENNRKREI